MAFLQNIFRKLVRNLLPGNSVEKILKVQICESSIMRDAIQLWWDMYENNPPWKGGPNKVIPTGLPAMIATKFMQLILKEFEIKISGSQMAKYLNKQLERDLTDLSKFVEWYCVGGGIAIYQRAVTCSILYQVHGRFLDVPADKRAGRRSISQNHRTASNIRTRDK